jgi:hypothetical protein
MPGAIGRAIVAGPLNALPMWKKVGKASDLRRGAGVAAYVGANGAGKSLLMALDTLPTLRGIPWYCDQPEHRHTASGITSGVRRVLSTMRFTTRSGEDHPLWVPLDDYDKLIVAEHCDVDLDEAGGAVASSSGGSDDVPAPVKAALQEQRRKDNLVRLTCPGWMRMVKPVRECVTMVNEIMGHLPVPHRFPVVFPGPHETETFDFDTSDLSTVRCEIDRDHEHDGGRLWGSRRLMVCKSYDARKFEDWSADRKNNPNIKPIARTAFWRPGSLAEQIYGTFDYVEKLGTADVCGACYKPLRVKRYCECEAPATRRARRQARSGLARVAPPDLVPVPAG